MYQNRDRKGCSFCGCGFAFGEGRLYVYGSLTGSSYEYAGLVGYDVRTYGTWEYPFYWVPQEKYGVRYVRGRIAEITYSPADGRLRVKHEDTIVQRPSEVPMDLVVLVLGMEPSPGTKKVAKILIGFKGA